MNTSTSTFADNIIKLKFMETELSIVRRVSCETWTHNHNNMTKRENILLASVRYMKNNSSKAGTGRFMESSRERRSDLADILPPEQHEILPTRFAAAI